MKNDTQPAFNCSKSITETPVKCVKSVPNFSFYITMSYKQIKQNTYNSAPTAIFCVDGGKSKSYTRITKVKKIKKY